MNRNFVKKALCFALTIAMIIPCICLSDEEVVSAAAKKYLVKSVASDGSVVKYTYYANGNIKTKVCNDTYSSSEYAYLKDGTLSTYTEGDYVYDYIARESYYISEREIHKDKNFFETDSPYSISGMITEEKKDKNGNVTSRTVEEGSDIHTSIKYDGKGQMTEIVTKFDWSGEERHVTITYFDNGEVKHMEESYDSGAAYIYDYDEYGNCLREELTGSYVKTGVYTVDKEGVAIKSVLKTVYSDGETSEETQIYDYKKDSKGNNTYIKEVFYSDNYAEYNEHFWEYDANGNVTFDKCISGYGCYEGKFDENCIEKNVYETENKYNAKGKLLSTKHYYNGELESEYEYGEGGETLKEIVYVDGKIESGIVTKYDAKGRVVEKTEYDYDGWKTVSTYTEDLAIPNSLEYYGSATYMVYDENGTVIESSKNTKKNNSNGGFTITTTVDGQKERVRVYNKYGDLTKDTSYYGSKERTETFTYKYNKAGKKILERDDDGYFKKWTYNKAGYLTKYETGETEDGIDNVTFYEKYTYKTLKQMGLKK